MIDLNNKTIFTKILINLKQFKMKKVILTLVISLLFVAFSNAQSNTPGAATKKEVKTAVKQELKKADTSSFSVNTANTPADAKTKSCASKSKACCAGKSKAKACCAGKTKAKASCAGKPKASCDSKKKSEMKKAL